jgi:hypothetical protein
MRSVLVLGCGSIGQRHLRNAATLGVPERLGFDPDPARRAEAAATGATVFDDLEAALSAGADAEYVCTPPSSHVALALRALETGAHLFVEKPLSHARGHGSPPGRRRTRRLLRAPLSPGRECAGAPAEARPPPGPVETTTA